MLIERIILEGFLSYKARQVVDLSTVSTCLVLGRINGDPELSNGAGKSSLFEAIPVNFFGKSSGRSDTLDSYINDSCSKMYIEVIFLIDKQRYKTVRSKSRNISAIFEIFLDTTNKSLNKATWTKTDFFIDDILGLSSKTFSSTIYLNERESLQIITGTSSERKEILRELLNINVYEKASKTSHKYSEDFDRKFQVNLNLIKDRQKQLENEDEYKQKLILLTSSLEDAKLLLKNYETEKSEKNITKRQIEIFIEEENEVKKLIELHQKYIDDLLQQSLVLSDEIQKIDNNLSTQNSNFLRFKSIVDESLKNKKFIEKNIENLEKKIKSIDEADIKLSNVVIGTKNKKETESKLNIEKSVFEAEIIPIQNFVERLKTFEEDENMCPITESKCSTLTSGFKENLQIEKEQQIEQTIKKINFIKENLTSISSQIQQALKEESLLRATCSTRQKTNTILLDEKLKLQSVNNDDTRLKEKEIALNEYRIQVNEKKKEITSKLESNKISVEEFRDIVRDNEKKINVDLPHKLKIICEQIERIEVLEEKTKKVIEEKNREYGEIKYAINRFESIRLELQGFEKNNEEYLKKKKVYNSLSDIFGKDGIQKVVMKESIPILETYTLDFLKIFNDGSERIKVKFDLDPKKIDGELKKGGGLEILVLEEGKDPKDLQMYSGGETVRIVFSIVLSLAKLLSLRAGKKHETLIIDEKIAKLDSKGIIQFGEVISEISKIYKQVFVITHIETLKDLIAGNEIIVNKTVEGSQVSVI